MTVKRMAPNYLYYILGVVVACVALFLGAAVLHFNNMGFNVPEAAKFLYVNYIQRFPELEKVDAQKSSVNHEQIRQLVVLARRGNARAADRLIGIAWSQRDSLSYEEKSDMYSSAASTNIAQFTGDYRKFLLDYGKCKSAIEVSRAQKGRLLSRFWLNESAKKALILSIDQDLKKAGGLVDDYCPPFNEAKVSIKKIVGNEMPIKFDGMARGKSALCGKVNGRRFIKDGEAISIEGEGEYYAGEAKQDFDNNSSTFQAYWDERCLVFKPRYS